MQQPRLLVTRRLPAAVEARAQRDYDARLNADDRLYGPDELVRLAQEVDGVLTCSTERWPPAVVGPVALPGDTVRPRPVRPTDLPLEDSPDAKRPTPWLHAH